MRIISTFLICLFMMQGAAFAAPQCRSAKATHCSCCMSGSHKCCCCSHNVPDKPGQIPQKNVPLSTLPCNCTMPAAPARHETAVSVTENTTLKSICFLFAVHAVMPWQGFNYMRTSISATPPPIPISCSRVFCPLRI